MQFHLNFPIAPLGTTIQYDHELLLMGSCFAEEIGEKLHEHRFNTLINPHGILYNPLSIIQSLTAFFDKKIYTKADLFQYNDTWNSWDHHSRFSALTLEAALEAINSAHAAAIRSIERADWLILTLGSAHVYVHKKQQRVVANCHKVPAAEFYKRLLTVNEIVAALDNVIHRLFFLNRKIKVLFTVSPVRYIRDGLVENNLSKAVLLQSVHHLVNKFDRLYYFPAYELVIDDLRDYRFYKDDLVHPNVTAINYVWDKVVNSCIHPGSRGLLEAIATINRAARHRPFNPEGSQHQQFLHIYAGKVKRLMEEYPQIDMQDLLDYFERTV